MLNSGANPEQAVHPLILILAGYDLVRESLRDWLSTELPSCRCIAASTDEKALATACAEGPDMTVMELDVPNLEGAKILRAVRLACPGSDLLVLSDHAEEIKRICAETAGPIVPICRARIDAELPSLIETALRDRRSRGGGR